MAERIEITVVESERRMRLEDLLCARFPALSKMYLRDVVKNAECEVNGRNENIGKRVFPNDFIEIEVDLTREHSMLPQDIPIDVVHEDADLIVVNKPAGMLVHPSHYEKNGTLLNAVVHRMNQSNVGLHQRPGLIHRLDKDTSGLIVLAKNPRAHRILCSHFQRKLVEKRYSAMVDGVVSEDHGTINGNIGRNADAKIWEVKADGKPAETRFWVRERLADRTLVELEPVTGRTNQLRIHCAAIGHPIVGDLIRGGSRHDRMCLHASALSFRHPSGGEAVRLTSEMPDWTNDKSSS